MASSNIWKERLAAVRRSTTTQRRRIKEQANDLTRDGIALATAYAVARLEATSALPTVAGIDPKLFGSALTKLIAANTSGNAGNFFDGMALGMGCAGLYAQGMKDAAQAATQATAVLPPGEPVSAGIAGLVNDTLFDPV